MSPYFERSTSLGSGGQDASTEGSVLIGWFWRISTDTHYGLWVRALGRSVVWDWRLCVQCVMPGLQGRLAELQSNVIELFYRDALAFCWFLFLL